MPYKSGRLKDNLDLYAADTKAIHEDEHSGSFENCREMRCRLAREIRDGLSSDDGTVAKEISRGE